MKFVNLKKILLFSVLVVLFSCETEYTKLVKKELSSGKINNNVFYNLELGQSRKDFYRICWNLNRRGIATHGPSNNYVQTFLIPKDSTKLTEKIRMLFYAKFNSNDTITAMDVKFSYVGWSPWNRELIAENLLPVVQDTLLKWYPGNPFIKTKNGYLVKVDGNRQIQIGKESDRDVAVLIEDLAYKYNNLNK